MNDLGRKVLFLYPPRILTEGVMTHLINHEYEIYLINDTRRAELIFEKYPDTICFVNIDTALSEPEWEQWIRKIRANPAFDNVGLGIVSYNNNEDLQKKYLLDIGIKCGYIKLKLGVEESTKILLTTLQANEAKGRRKYVRANATHDTISGVNFTHGRLQVTGKIIDISVVGFACVLDPDPELEKNVLLSDVQLRLRASLLRTNLIVLGSRVVDGEIHYIFLFPPRIENHDKGKIRSYVQTALQTSMDMYLDEAIKNAPKDAGFQPSKSGTDATTTETIKLKAPKLDTLEDKIKSIHEGLEALESFDDL